MQRRVRNSLILYVVSFKQPNFQADITFKTGAFLMSNRVTTDLIFLSFDWLLHIFSQSNDMKT